jgi:hypothetical protein
MGFEGSALLFTLSLFFVMLLLIEAGRRVGVQRRAKDPDGASAGVGAIEGSIFGLLGLLLAFTFSGAASRFDVRRQLIIEETNNIGTAYLRLDLLPVAAQPALRESFRQYVDARLATYRKLPDMTAAREELAKATKLQSEIWNQAVAATQEANSPATTTLVFTALNAMIDITTTRTMATQIHPPTIIFVMLIGLAFASSLLAGYGMANNKTRSWMHMLGFAIAIAIAVYVILDLEFPRFGLIRVDAFDQALVDLRQSMK